MGKVADDLEKLWFNDECVLLKDAGASPYGGIAGEELPFKGKVRQSTVRVNTPNGEVTQTETIIYFPLRIVVAHGDQVRLPEPYDPGPWEITETAVFEGAGNETPNHQKAVLTLAGDDGSGDPYPGDDGGPYG